MPAIRDIILDDDTIAKLNDIDSFVDSVSNYVDNLRFLRYHGDIDDVDLVARRRLR